MDKVKMIEAVVEAYRETNAFIDQVGEMFGVDTGSRFWRSHWRTFDLLLERTKTAIGDEHDWLNWYVWDNECGDAGYEATIDGECRAVHTPDDLLWAIGAHADRVISKGG